MAEHEQYQLDGNAPELYQRYLVPAVTTLWAADLIQRAAPLAGERVLDVACGTGVVARMVAELVKTGRVVGLDINAGMLEVARSLSQAPDSPIEWQEGSATDLPFAAASFDLVLCQLGLQFFPDRPAALREMRRVLVQGGRLGLSVYSTIEHTPAAYALAQALDRHIGLGASKTKRSEHALANAEELRELATGVGFQDVAIRTTTQALRFPSAREYVRIQLAASPMAYLVSGLENGKQQAIVEAITGDLIDAMGADGTEGGFSFPQEGHVLLARK